MVNFNFKHDWIDGCSYAALASLQGGRLLKFSSSVTFFAGLSRLYHSCGSEQLRCQPFQFPVAPSHSSGPLPLHSLSCFTLYLPVVPSQCPDTAMALNIAISHSVQASQRPFTAAALCSRSANANNHVLVGTHQFHQYRSP